MGVRDDRQLEAVEAYLASDRRSIINACPRFGKIKVALEIIKRLGVKHIWLFAPRNDIFQGWSDDMAKFGKIPMVGKCTFASIKKINTSVKPELVIVDEPHELSINQQASLAEKVKDLPILALTGTMTDKTREELFDSLTLDTCYRYDISEGVEDGILADYEIYLHQVKLEKLEGKKFSQMKYALGKTKSPMSRHFINLKMINLIQKSEAKRLKTIELLKKYHDERVLVFCGVTEVADNLGILAYHSKKKERQIFLDFCLGRQVDQLATIKMMQAGVTINPINRGIVNYMSGNPEDSAQKICRFLGFEYQNPNKKAIIHVITTDEDFELQRMKTGLRFFDEDKITYL